MMKANHPTIVDYVIARRDYEEAKARASNLHHHMKAAERRLVDAMIDAETKTIKRTDGLSFTVTPSIGFAANEANFDQTQEWLSENGLTPEDYISRRTNRKRLRTTLKEFIQERGEVDLPEFLEIDTTPIISVRGWSKVENS